MDELEFLAETAGAKTVKRFTQKLDYPNPKTFVGKGKMDEILEKERERKKKKHNYSAVEEDERVNELKK